MRRIRRPQKVSSRRRGGKSLKKKRKAENWELRSFTKRVTQQLRSKYFKTFPQKTSVKFWPMVRKSQKQCEKKED